MRGTPQGPTSDDFWRKKEGRPEVFSRAGEQSGPGRPKEPYEACLHHLTHGELLALQGGMKDLSTGRQSRAKQGKRSRASREREKSRAIGCVERCVWLWAGGHAVELILEVYSVVVVLQLGWLAGWLLRLHRQ